MPLFEDKKQSALEMRLQEKEQESKDKNVWLKVGDKEGDSRSGSVGGGFDKWSNNGNVANNGSLAMGRGKEQKREAPAEPEPIAPLSELPLENLLGPGLPSHDTLPKSNSSPSSVSSGERPVGIPKEVVPAMRKAFFNLLSLTATFSLKTSSSRWA